MARASLLRCVCHCGTGKKRSRWSLITEGGFEWKHVREPREDVQLGAGNLLMQKLCRGRWRAWVQFPVMMSVGAVMRCRSLTMSNAEIMSQIAPCPPGSSASNVLVTRSMRSGRRAAVASVTRRAPSGVSQRRPTTYCWSAAVEGDIAKSDHANSSKDASLRV